ncbi:MAG: phage portal protein [Raoultibacter sp.]
MGLFEYLKARKQNYTYSKMMGGGMPVFSQFGQNIYASDVVQQCIHTITTEMKKLQAQHIRKVGFDVEPQVGAVQTVLENPNPLMTMADFIEKTIWLLLLNYNAFILPTFDYVNGKRRLTGLWPLQPARVDFLEDPSGKMFIRFYFANGHESEVAYEDIIHIRYRYAVNEYMGGNQFGQPDNTALLETLDLNDTLLQGVAKGLKAAYAVNGVIKYNTMFDSEKTEAAIKELEQQVRNSESGFMALDLKGEFVPFKRDIKLVDTDTLKFIESKILRHFGVSLPILTGEFTPEDLAAFYQKSLESMIVSMTQAFTKGVFTANERAHGNSIAFYPEELIFMSTDQTLEMIAQLGPSGTIYENEKRTAFGLRPLPELAGKRMMSLNWVDVDYARDYQLNEQGGVADGNANDRAR